MSEDQDIRGRAEQRIGSVLHGKYRLDGILGIGGMAVVYAATHRNQKKVAVKVLHPELSLRGAVRARFLREGYAANAVEHEGVVAVLDDDVDEGGSAFLVLELLQGLDVHSWCARSGGRLPLQTALNITHQLLQILAAAHAKGVIHRDLKPANLFMQHSGRLKVLDFGIARVLDGALGGEVTRTGALLGTPAFMAPELASAQRDAIDARTDLWAVGATLFRLVSGEHVHPGEHANQVLIRAATAEARSVLAVVPELPAPAVELIARALAFEKEARFQSAAEMASAVLRVHEQLFGELWVEPLPASLAAEAQLAVPLSNASVAASTEAERVSPTVSAGVQPSAAERRTGEHSNGVESLFSPSSQRSRPRRMASLLGVAVALLGAGLAFDWYASRVARAQRVQAQPAQALRAPASGPEVSFRAALPATLESALPTVSEPPVRVTATVAPARSPAAPLRRATVRRVSTASELTPPRIGKNPLDVELQ